MNIDIAWEIVEQGKYLDESEDSVILFEEALNYILQDSIELCEKDDFYMWKTDVQAAAYNLGSHYEKIGKYDLAIKYYKISEEYGCSFARDRMEQINNER